jgi:hypothetical protein
VTGTDILALDATEENEPLKVFDALQPDILVVCGGALPVLSENHAREQFCSDDSIRINHN